MVEPSGSLTSSLSLRFLLFFFSSMFGSGTAVGLVEVSTAFSSNLAFSSSGASFLLRPFSFLVDPNGILAVLSRVFLDSWTSRA